ncbi:helix-turn-helix transcriptional regulator [Tautonia rosea]|uniref:helix-turn-helix transcriptional regulator n=1 Tax=Tautonia rosea TaxID=2728037 RepID=UPI00147539CC|nr:helix-turn-helix domain-containing protein [Tautonia rosea]
MMKRPELPEALTMPEADTRFEAPTRPPVDRLALRLDEVAEAIGVSRRTIERERSAGRFPKPDRKIGKVSLWSVETIRAWIEGGGA